MKNLRCLKRRWIGWGVLFILMMLFLYSCAIPVRQVYKVDGSVPVGSIRGDYFVGQRYPFQVKIPAGVDTGSKLRIRGEGEEGERGGPPGELFVFLYVEPHDFFSRDGDDIICQIGISFTQAALGAEIEVPTLNGTKTLTIPRGSEAGEIFRIKGEGFPKLRGYGRGDEVVQIILKTPKNLTKRQEELLREFEEIGVKKGKEGEGWRKFFSN